MRLLYFYLRVLHIVQFLNVAQGQSFKLLRSFARVTDSSMIGWGVDAGYNALLYFSPQQIIVLRVPAAPRHSLLVT